MPLDTALFVFVGGAGKGPVQDAWMGLQYLN